MASQHEVLNSEHFKLYPNKKLQRDIENKACKLTPLLSNHKRKLKNTDAITQINEMFLSVLKMHMEFSCYPKLDVYHMDTDIIRFRPDCPIGCALMVVQSN
uniref:Uncharacterized protein n=1 Tax=Rhizophora mucronata TaxID=61149 RepID=A0A2P2QRV9_RHIMU